MRLGDCVHGPGQCRDDDGGGGGFPLLLVLNGLLPAAEVHERLGVLQHLVVVEGRDIAAVVVGGGGGRVHFADGCAASPFFFGGTLHGRLFVNGTDRLPASFPFASVDIDAEIDLKLFAEALEPWNEEPHVGIVVHDAFPRRQRPVHAPDVHPWLKVAGVGFDEQAEERVAAAQNDARILRSDHVKVGFGRRRRGQVLVQFLEADVKRFERLGGFAAKEVHPSVSWMLPGDDGLDVHVLAKQAWVDSGLGVDQRAVRGVGLGEALVGFLHLAWHLKKVGGWEPLGLFIDLLEKKK